MISFMVTREAPSIVEFRDWFFENGWSSTESENDWCWWIASDGSGVGVSLPVSDMHPEWDRCALYALLQLELIGGTSVEDLYDEIVISG